METSEWICSWLDVKTPHVVNSEMMKIKSYSRQNSFSQVILKGYSNFVAIN